MTLCGSGDDITTSSAPSAVVAAVATTTVGSVTAPSLATGLGGGGRKGVAGLVVLVLQNPIKFRIKQPEGPGNCITPIWMGVRILTWLSALRKTNSVPRKGPPRCSAA